MNQPGTRFSLGSLLLFVTICALFCSISIAITREVLKLSWRDSQIESRLVGFIAINTLIGLVVGMLQGNRRRLSMVIAGGLVGLAVGILLCFVSAVPQQRMSVLAAPLVLAVLVMTVILTVLSRTAGQPRKPPGADPQPPEDTPDAPRVAGHRSK